MPLNTLKYLQKILKMILKENVEEKQNIVTENEI